MEGEPSHVKHLSLNHVCKIGLREIEMDDIFDQDDVVFLCETPRYRKNGGSVRREENKEERG